MREGGLDWRPGAGKMPDWNESDRDDFWCGTQSFVDVGHDFWWTGEERRVYFALDDECDWFDIGS